MLQMLMKSGGNEQVLDLTEVPEFVLVQSCDTVLRHWDLRNPDARWHLAELIDALKVKAEEEPTGKATFDRYSLRKYVAQIEGLIEQFDENRVEGS